MKKILKLKDTAIPGTEEMIVNHHIQTMSQNSKRPRPLAIAIGQAKKYPRTTSFRYSHPSTSWYSLQLQQTMARSAHFATGQAGCSRENRSHEFPSRDLDDVGRVIKLNRSIIEKENQPLLILQADTGE